MFDLFDQQAAAAILSICSGGEPGHFAVFAASLGFVAGRALWTRPQPNIFFRQAESFSRLVLSVIHAI